MNNKEVYYEGWLIKSPPQRIWKARWRRRFFTLKQGEIPQQFCLEYYTDRCCRKLKGTIDLDQCEEVECGLRMEDRKSKFQYIFAVKTQKRIYYLAAEQEEQMRDWVKCICQVCNLHDTKQLQPINFLNDNQRQYYNLCENEIPNEKRATQPVQKRRTANSSNETCTTSLYSSSNASNSTSQTGHGATSASEVIKRVQNNDNDMPYVNAEYSNRETLVCDQKLPQQLDYTNLPAIGAGNAEPQRSPSSQKQNKKKIPENLVLTNQTLDTEVEPSPALSTCSGPYIPISECFSGSPRYLVGGPKTPLNNLDPPTNRSYNNIGFNLTTSDQSYSPKITNFSSFGSGNDSKSRSGRCSPTDSESVFTDDEMTSSNPGPSNQGNATSDTYENLGALGGFIDSRKRKDQKDRLILENISDTENTSPSIVTKNLNTGFQYLNINDHIHDKIHSPDNPIAASTPNLMAVAAASASGQQKQNMNFTNAAIVSRTLPRSGAISQNEPRQIEGNVFRYDFDIDNLPPVDRKLKPKNRQQRKESMDEPISPHQQVPQVDRKLKPSVAPREPASANVMEIRTLPKYIYANGDENSLQAAPPTQHKLQYIELDIAGSSSSSGPGLGPMPMPKSVSNRISLISLNNNNNVFNMANPALRHHRSASMSSQKSVDSNLQVREAELFTIMWTL
uniref:PH domain-containing protein n=1 Tax=Megaselia scalaris TaxID=36166 RepID=T1GUE0_MEGSC